jgi:hypothetical protein
MLSVRSTVIPGRTGASGKSPVGSRTWLVTVQAVNAARHDVAIAKDINFALYMGRMMV